MGLVSDPKERETMLAAERKRREEATTKANGMLADEVRVCTRCGWKAQKSYCLANGISACPVCGNAEARGYSMDFDPDMLRLGGRPQ